VKFSLRHKKGDGPTQLHRRHLPFYMKPVILIAFILISFTGMFLWSLITTVYLKGVDPRWGSFGFAIGITLGFIHGKWTSRMWNRDYLRVLKREMSFWDAKGAMGTTVYIILALGVPIFVGLFFKRSYNILIALQSYIFGFIGGMNYALYAWVRRLPP
jgi:hypothetical protein